MGYEPFFESCDLLSVSSISSSLAMTEYCVDGCESMLSGVDVSSCLDKPYQPAQARRGDVVPKAASARCSWGAPSKGKRVSRKLNNRRTRSFGISIRICFSGLLSSPSLSRAIPLSKSSIRDSPPASLCPCPRDLSSEFSTLCLV